MSDTIGFQKLSKPQIAAMSGASIWETIGVLGTGTTSNSPDEPLKRGFKVKDLAAPAAYYHENQFGGLQLVVRYDDKSNEFNFVSPLHDKDGNPILSTSNTYRIEEVRCVRDFPVPDSDKIIKVGDVMLKAYAV